MLLLPKFLIRWLVCSLGLWIAAAIVGTDGIDYGGRAKVIVIAGLVLAIINMFIRPIVVVLSLPAILLSLGLFMIVINGLMIMLVGKLYSSLHIGNFWAAVLAGIVIGLVNYLVTAILEERKQVGGPLK